MPAATASLIPPALVPLRDQSPAGLDEFPGLPERLAEVTDQHDPCGAHHVVVYVLALTTTAVLAGTTSLLVISEWAASVPQGVLLPLEPDATH